MPTLPRVFANRQSVIRQGIRKRTGHRSLIYIPVAVALFINGVATLGQIVITDPGFEGLSRTISSPALGGTATGTIGAWNVSVTSLAGLNASVAAGNLLGGPTPPEGTRDLRLSVPIGFGASESISQTLSASLSANTEYRLSVWISAGSTVSLLSSGSLQLRAGGNPLTSLTGTSLTSLINPNGSFSKVTLVYQTGSQPISGLMGIYFGVSSTATIGGNIYLDNFQLTSTSIGVSPIPEPESYAIASGVCLASFAWLRWRTSRRD